jgi:hypothetical protein
MERDVAKIIRDTLDTLDTFDTLDAAAKVKETTTPEHEEALVPKAAIPVGLPAHCEVGHGRP